MKLSNGLVKFDFDDATGNICQIKDLKTGKEYLPDPRGYRMMKVGVVDDNFFDAREGGGILPPFF